MLNRLQRILAPWLGSAALFLIAATTGYGAFSLAFVTVNLGWVGPNTPVPDDISRSMVVFFWASTLALALLNLALKRVPLLPLIVAGGMALTFYLLVLLLLGMMQGALWSGPSSGGDRLLNGAIAIFAGLNILLIRYLLVGTTSDGIYGQARVALAAGSGLLLLYLLVPWSTGWRLLQTDAARDQAAVATFGATYIAAKTTLQTCPAFQQSIGGLVELTVSPHRGTLTDRPNYAIGSYSFSYRGQRSRGRVGISITQTKATGPSPNGSSNSADSGPSSTDGPISVIPVDGQAPIQIRCDTENKGRKTPGGSYRSAFAAPSSGQKGRRVPRHWDCVPPPFRPWAAVA